jgi:Protein of unknown function (DUF3987)
MSAAAIKKPDFKRVDKAAAALDAAHAQPTTSPQDFDAKTEATADRLARAQALLMPSSPAHTAPPYPVDALGPLADVCRVIAQHGQIEPAMVGQCLLGAASLLVQGLFNVQSLTGPRPLSLYLLTLGLSGDGKSEAQKVALQAVHQWQRKKATAHAAELDAQRQAPRNNKEPPPPPPTPPYRISRDATVEALRRDLDTGLVSQGLFSDEAAAIVSGYGMSAEQKAKSAATFSGLWDNGHLSVSRATTGRVERYGKRLAMHWMLQPQAATESTTDGQLIYLGFWPRFLLAWPEPSAPRLYRPFVSAEHSAITDWWARCDVLLAEPLPDDASPPSDPGGPGCPVLPLAADARGLLGRALEGFERDSKRGALRPVRPFGLRATEQACRVAGVLAAYAGHAEVTLQDATDALALVTYSVQSWLALLGEAQAVHTHSHALALYAWLNDPKHCPEHRSPKARMLTNGPNAVRSKDKRDAALQVLVDAGLVTVDDANREVQVCGLPSEQGPA